MNTITQLPIRRVDEISVLGKLIPLSQASTEECQNLATRFSMSGWKDLFIRLWQQEDQCKLELDRKYQELGGRLISWPEGVLSNPWDEECNDPFLTDKTLLFRCLNAKQQLFQAYANARRHVVSFDIRMLLQRHQLQSRDTMNRLTSIHLSYTARPADVARHYFQAIGNRPD